MERIKEERDSKLFFEESGWGEKEERVFWRSDVWREEDPFLQLERATLKQVPLSSCLSHPQLWRLIFSHQNSGKVTDLKAFWNTSLKHDSLYFISLPPAITTIHELAAWTFQLQLHLYPFVSPLKLSVFHPNFFRTSSSTTQSKREPSSLDRASAGEKLWSNTSCSGESSRFQREKTWRCLC